MADFITPIDANIRRNYHRKTWHFRKNKSLFGSLTKRSDEGIIHEYQEGLTNARSMSVPLVGEITRRGYGMRSNLEGNEAAVTNASTDVFPHWLREATVVHVVDAHEASFNIYAEQRPVLNRWLVNMDNTRAIEAFWSVANDANQWLNDSERVTGRSVPFSAASTAQRSAYVTDNADRLYFGRAANLATGDWDASVGNIGAGETMGAEVLRDVVDFAEQTDWENGVYRIHPYEDGEDNEAMFLVLHDSASFRALKRDAEIMDYHKAMIETHLPAAKGQKHPYIRGGDVIYERTVNRLCREMDAYVLNRLRAADGAQTVDLCGAVLAGRQALIKGVGMVAKPTRRSTKDYETKRGVGTMAMDTYEKVFFREGGDTDGPGKQFSSINIFTARN